MNKLVKEFSEKINARSPLYIISYFIVGGRGGLPQNPDELFNGNTIYTELFNLIPTQDLTSKTNFENSSLNVNKKKIIEATAWIFDEKGDVILVAENPESTQKYSGINSVSCKDFSVSPK